MNRVHRLPPEVAERIAAGEVIDRPTSIVKELVENSIDAGATRIEVEILDGGRELIRVTDDGVGMSREDAELSVERHATSKLRAWEDLETLDSFGFRGEALPSVAAVSRFEMVTTARGQEVGTRLRMEGPLAVKVEPAAGPPGTRIDVRDLFWNTPARRKFLKSAVGEGTQIAELLSRFAVLNPTLGFRLVINDKERLFFSPETSLTRRLAELWKLEEADLLPLSGERDGFRVEGVMAKPTFHRRNRGAQILAVNGRLIRSTTLSQAFTEGFDPLVPRGRHPYVYAGLRVDPSEVDVNIHPTKAEVRFANDRAPFRVLFYAIKGTLEAQSAETLKFGAWETVLDDGGPVPLSEPVPVVPPVPLVTGRPPASRPAPDLRPPAPPFRGAGQVMELFRPPTPEEAPERDFELSYPDPEPQPTLAREQPVEQLDLMPEPSSEREPEIRYLSTLYRSYLVMEVDRELWVVDQHAAHERIQYERLHRFQILGPVSQGLVVPLPLNLGPSEREVLEAQPERFSEVGFELEIGSEVRLKAVPPGLPGGKVETFFAELLSELVDEGLTESTPMAQYREKLRAMMACKSSVRAREAVSELEAVRLVRDLIAAERSPYCPHGRPTRIRLDQTALERLFHRS